MPLWEYFKVSSTTRMSFAFYNTTTEIDTAVETLLQTQELFA
jgi:selenocysteine lyase/cysteine desulfurase